MENRKSSAFRELLVFMDISRVEQHQNVQETGFNGHFKCGAAPECLRKRFQKGFSKRNSTKMSRKGFNGHFDGKAAPRR